MDQLSLFIFILIGVVLFTITSCLIYKVYKDFCYSNNNNKIRPIAIHNDNNNNNNNNNNIV